MIGINIAIILMIIVYKKYKKHFITCLIISNIIYFMYYFILGCMYLLSMPWEEALYLAAFDRYMLTIIFIIIGLVLIFFINIVIKEKHMSKKSIILSTCFIFSILFISFKYYIPNPKFLIGDLDYKNSTAYKYDKILETRNYVANYNDYYYIYVPISAKKDSGYTFYLTKYKLNSTNFQFIYDISNFNPSKKNTYNEKFIVLKNDNKIYKYLQKNGYQKQGKMFIKKKSKQKD